jgi:GTP-binding protein
MADVGIIGLPNAGKSTLIRAVSSATPKTADYPFTTLSPTLGMVTPKKGEPFAVADIPGIIEGAHQGAGLGLQFLRHIDRTRILLHLIDVTAIDPSDPLYTYQIVNQELSSHSESLTQKIQLVVLNKLDVEGSPEKAAAFCRALPDRDVLMISALTHDGIDNLITKLVYALEATNG